MAAYSDDPTTVCSQTFDDAALQQSFPGSTAPRQLNPSFDLPITSIAGPVN
jgi:hypothetical protein